MVPYSSDICLGINVKRRALAEKNGEGPIGKILSADSINLPEAVF